ncbi:MAG TPA: DUF2279 domain-containing protein [Ignavibacteriaceae bacterium]|nr:DUF2279 domain-containing protein [Ignavibacteriaceae bacterium]
MTAAVLSPKSSINLARLSIVGGIAITALGGIYYRWKTAWWSNGTTKFHFYYDPGYAVNVDKIGHIYGGILFAECFGAGLKWSGFDRESSLLYGAVFSTLVYTGVELKDGFAPGWGFDVGDIGGSALGSFYPYMQEKISFLRNFNIKWSYFPSHSTFFKDMNKDSQNNQFFNDDYEGQTFWLSADIKNLLPERIGSFLPDFLNLACGISAENLDDPAKRTRVFVISPDIDITKLFNTDSEFLNTIFHLLNYIHIPLPALQVSPHFKGYPLYLKP